MRIATLLPSAKMTSFLLGGMILLALTTVTPTTLASPTGAAACPGGTAAVGGSHLGQTSVTEGSLASGDLEFSINGEALSSGENLQIMVGEEYEWTLAQDISQNGFRGFLVRLGGGGDSDLGGSLDGTGGRIQQASVCPDTVGGVTHTSRILKDSIGGTLVVTEAADDLQLDVTVVVVNANGVSEYYYSGYSVRAVEMEDEEGDDEFFLEQDIATVEEETEAPTEELEEEEEVEEEVEEEEAPEEEVEETEAPTEEPEAEEEVEEEVEKEVEEEVEEETEAPTEEMVEDAMDEEVEEEEIAEEEEEGEGGTEIIVIEEEEETPAPTEEEEEEEFEETEEPTVAPTPRPTSVPVPEIDVEDPIDNDVDENIDDATFPVEDDFVVEDIPQDDDEDITLLEDDNVDSAGDDAVGDDATDDFFEVDLEEAGQNTISANSNEDDDDAADRVDDDYLSEDEPSESHTISAVSNEDVTDDDDDTTLSAVSVDEESGDDTPRPESRPSSSNTANDDGDDNTGDADVDAAVIGDDDDNDDNDNAVDDDDGGEDDDADADDEPSVESDSNLKPLRSDRCTESNPCDRCFGDCDSDSDCASGLECFYRRDGETTSIPGCGGRGSPGTDYCYRPRKDMLRARIEQCSEDKPCSECQGDCDSHDECKGRLKCFARSSSDKHEDVPGCHGDTHGTIDYCYDPGNDRDDDAYGYRRSFLRALRNEN